MGFRPSNIFLLNSNEQKSKEVIKSQILELNLLLQIIKVNLILHNLHHFGVLKLVENHVENNEMPSSIVQCGK